jgi:hypothetical protein
MTPSSLSPVLKTKVTFNLQSTFPDDLNENDFSVNATRLTVSD